MSSTPPYQRISNHRRVTIGVCAMDKKTRSQPMIQILDRLLAYGDFEIIVFGNRLILDDSIPVEDWPLCDCLISFWSSKFPIEKAIRYVQLRKPFCINDLPSQLVFTSRSAVYKVLDHHRIPAPRHLFVDRSDPDNPPNFAQTDEYIECNGERMYFPLVEKPIQVTNYYYYFFLIFCFFFVSCFCHSAFVPLLRAPRKLLCIRAYMCSISSNHICRHSYSSVGMFSLLSDSFLQADDHAVYIYYGRGQGSRRLFRKVENRSSQYYANVSLCRTDGSYIYEEFMKNGTPSCFFFFWFGFSLAFVCACVYTCVCMHFCLCLDVYRSEYVLCELLISM